MLKEASKMRRILRLVTFFLCSNALIASLLTRPYINPYKGTDKYEPEYQPLKLSSHKNEIKALRKYSERVTEFKKRPDIRGKAALYFKKGDKPPEVTPLEVSVSEVSQTIKKLYEYREEVIQSHKIDPIPENYAEFIGQQDKVSPFLSAELGATSIIDWLNGIGIGNFFQDSTKKLLSSPETFSSFNSMNRWDIWLEPFCFLGKTEGLEDLPLNLTSYGVGIGGARTFSHHLTLGVGLGYIHTGFSLDQGKGTLDGLFAGPYMGYFSDQGYFSLSVLGVWNRYHVSRAVEYSVLENRRDSILKRDYDTWNLNVKGECGKDFQLGGPKKEAYYLRPVLGAEYLIVIEPSQVEKEKAKEVFKIEASRSSFLRFRSLFQFRKHFFLPDFGFLIPQVELGWAYMKPLSHDHYTVSFSGPETVAGGKIQKPTVSSSQLLIGARFTAIHNRAIQTSLGYEGQLLGKYHVHAIKLLFNWYW